MRHIRQRDRGVTIVEAAFALPILFLFTFGLVDLGMWTFNSNQAANAARDGARTGILAYEFADDPDNDPKVVTDRAAIVAAVREHLPDQTIDDEDVTITCVTPDGTPVEHGCHNARLDEDRIRVDIGWTWDLVTPVAAVVGVDKGAARASATMGIVGRPFAGAPPGDTTTSVPSEQGDCEVTNLTVPASISSKGNQLQEHLTVEFTTDGSVGCSALRVELLGTRTSGPDGARTSISHSCGCDDGPGQFSWTYSGSNNIWKASPPLGEVRIFNGSDLLATKTFTVN